MTTFTRITCTSIVSCLLPTVILAAPSIPGSATPQQVSRSIVSSEPESTTPPGESYLGYSGAQSEALKAHAGKVKFKLNGIVLEGNKIFSDEELAPLYEADLHHVITLERLLAITQGITDFYRQHGYISSRAVLPVQATKHGIVHIDIVEGRIDKVIVTGDPKKSAALVQKMGDNIAATDPLQVRALEKYTLLANEIPGTQVHTILRPSPSVAGASDLYLLTNHTNFTGYVSYDNYRTRYIGPQQMTVDLEANSLLTSGDQGQFIFAKTPKGQELTFLNANYSMALDGRGERILLGMIDDKTHPLFALQPFNINGVDKNYYTTISIPQIRTLTTSLTYFISANYENADVSTFHQKLYTDQIRSLGLGVSYNVVDAWRGVNSIYADLRQGLPVLGYSTQTNPLTARTSRPGGHAVYTKVDLSLNRLQPLYNNFSLYGLLKGQYGFESLLVSEQFAYGGMEVGRGYDIAEMLGDRAIGGSLEARYDWHVNRFDITSLEPYAFYDIGKVWNITPIAGLPQNQSAASAGVGMRFALVKYVSANVTWAKPLTKQVAAEQLIRRGHDARTFFSIVASVS